MSPTDDLLTQLLRLAGENWYYILMFGVGLLAEKRGTLSGAIQRMAAASAKARVETGEHAKVLSGNGTSIRATVLSVEMLRDDVLDIRRAIDTLTTDVDAKIKRQADDYERYVEAMGASLTAYTREQIEAVRSEYDTRIGGELTEIKRMLEARLPR